MEGILLVNKPVGWTSFDAVNYIRKIIATEENKRSKQIKVGHCGTLDPFATGLLILLVGKTYTKRANELSKLDKTYEVTMTLGCKSTTGDPEGVIEEVSKDIPESIYISKALNKFTGNIMQTPPIYSAIKVDGQRAYKLARSGKTVKLESRPVKIYKLELVSYKYPLVSFIAEVSSGTYIRSLVEDIGEYLGTSAYTSQLKRTKIGGYEIKDSINVKAIVPPIKLSDIK